MRIIVISPDKADPREEAAMEGLFASGLERYHVRKPGWSAAELEAWLLRLPNAWRRRLFLHGHHFLAAKLGLAGRHEKDREGYGEPPGESRSCHDLPSLRMLLGRHAQVLLGPVFPSLSKEGHRPAADFPWEELKGVLGRMVEFLVYDEYTAKEVAKEVERNGYLELLDTNEEF